MTRAERLMTLTAHARELGVTLAGSLLAAPVDHRVTVARRLVRSGHWVHADVIEGSFRGQPGLARDELRRLEPVADVLDVHLMVDDPAAAIALLPVAPRRLTIQVRALARAERLLRRARACAAQVWLAVETVAEPDLEELRRLGPDGVLVMLTPPGAEGCAADLNRLLAVQGIRGAQLAVGVDGGVTAQNLPLAAAAGVTYAVSGRHLLGERHQELSRAHPA